MTTNAVVLLLEKYKKLTKNEINDKEAKLTRDTMSFNIKKYVTLYREVFGTTS